MGSLKVIGERILVKLHEVNEEEVTSSGIIIETQQTEPKTHVEGTVVQLGKGDFGVKVGDTVLYGPQSGVDFEHEGVVYTLLSPRHLIAVYTSPKEVKNDGVSKLKLHDNEFFNKVTKKSLI